MAWPDETGPVLPALFFNGQIFNAQTK